jgi:hypothetical protein
MLTLERCKALLEEQDEVAGVEECEGEWLRGEFPNPLQPDRPRTLIVHPILGRLILKVRVPAIAQARRSAGLAGILADFNYRQTIGKVGVDKQDGEVMFEINHACQDGDTEDPSPDVFARLIEAAVETSKRLTVMVTFVGMVEAGVPQDVARRFVSESLGNEPDMAAEDTPTL